MTIRILLSIYEGTPSMNEIVENNKVYGENEDGDRILLYSLFDSYFIVHINDSETKRIKEITVKGFEYSSDEIKNIFSRGYGLKQGLQSAFENYILKNSKIRSLTVDKNKPTKFVNTRGGYNIVLNYDDIYSLAKILSSINYESSREKRCLVKQFFHDKCNKIILETISNDYKKARILSHLSTIDVDVFTKSDIETIDSFYHRLLSTPKNSQYKKEVVTRNKIVIDNVVISRIISDYEKNIKSKVNETVWQSFFAENLLLFDSRYIDFIPTPNIEMGTSKKPDFLVIDIYNYIDVIELKKSTTKLLEFDTSRNQYYWSADASKSIAQLDKYLHLLDSKAETLPKSLRRMNLIRYEEDARIIRSKGMLIIGHSSQLDRTNKKEDFEILRRSLTKIDIVLYDELLERLKNLIKIAT